MISADGWLRMLIDNSVPVTVGNINNTLVQRIGSLKSSKRPPRSLPRNEEKNAQPSRAESINSRSADEGCDRCDLIFGPRLLWVLSTIRGIVHALGR